MIRAGNVRYEYDSKDRMVKKIDGEDNFVYSYNDLDQLISVIKNGTEVAGFSYDLAGRRVAETINGQTKEYLWSGDSLLAEYSVNTPDRLYAVGNGVDEVLGIYDDGGTQYLHSNHVGSITGVTDESGIIKGRKDYTPFGLTRSVEGEIDTDLAFIGREHYEEIRLTYIRARFYEPSSGRFITKDPVRDGFNWYSYCNGNPVKYVDRDGNTVEILVCGKDKQAGILYRFLGHVALRISNDKIGDIAYSFGRYGDTWGFLGHKGEGVLRVYPDAEKYISKEQLMIIIYLPITVLL